MASKHTKPLVLLLTLPGELEVLMGALQDVADVQSHPNFLSIHTTQLSEDHYANAVVFIVGTKASIDKDLLEKCPKLQLVMKYAIGFDNIDIQYAARIGVCVCNIPDYGVEEVADSTFSHILNLFRQTTRFHNQLQSGRVFASDKELKEAGTSIRRIRGKTLGLIGIGNIGTAVAERAKAFGFKVIFFDPYIPVGFDKAHGIERVDSVESVARRSDCVSLHCMLTPETRSIIDESILRLFKKEAFLINVSRGALVDERALADALREGRIAAAGLDVFTNEPFSLKGSIYEDVPNIYLTPHVSWYSPESLDDMRQSCIKYVRYAITHTDPNGLPTCVNRRQIDQELCKVRWSNKLTDCST